MTLQTRVIANALQGAKYELGERERAVYLQVNEQGAAVLDDDYDLNRPLILQVSRFDPWKDPLGVIQAYRLVKEEMPGVQLALIGAMAGDDPEGWELLDRVEEESANDPDMYVFTNVGGMGSMEANVFQRGCDVVLQKSLREGFGLVVSEAL